jgi:Zn-dependent M16 (insulinase) family peptidase
LPEINSNLNEYEHSISKAKLIHIENKDENNVFATTFRSRVDNSKGTPHILEHLMCCGSEKYPVRDPFMSMTKRSLSTYMNAWTGSDFISFPFASVN